MRISDSNPSVRIASERHAPAITQIYRLVQLDPEIFLQIARIPGNQSTPLDLIKALGGFISPPDERDMEMTLRHGLALVFVQNDEVVAYNRILTQADKVYQELCTELQIEQSIREFSLDSFTDWSGNKIKPTGNILKHVHWTNRDQALLACNAAIAGLEHKRTGRLAWAIDSAIHPGGRNLGISKVLVNGINNKLRPEYQCRIFRVFEILKINDKEITIENTLSKNAFVNASTQQFAFTEELVVINSNITLHVRWNYWLRHF